MIIWKNLITNSICIILGIIVIILIIYDNHIRYKNYSYDKNYQMLIISIIYFPLSIFFCSVTLLLLYNSPCHLKTMRMNYDCVACFDESETEGVLCHQCNQAGLCINCYYEWKKKSNTCPICRARYFIDV